jgi:hypothetical protein
LDIPLGIGRQTLAMSAHTACGRTIAPTPMPDAAADSGKAQAEFRDRRPETVLASRESAGQQIRLV